MRAVASGLILVGCTSTTPPTGSDAAASARSAPVSAPSASAASSASGDPGAVDSAGSRGKPIRPGELGGGLRCPCGCDRSELMATELLDVAGRQGPATAMDTIEEALAVIAEREDAGYVTVAMLDHRIRLLGLARSFSTGGETHGRGVAWAPPHRRPDAVASNDQLAVQLELYAHGETTELVHGKEKLLRASFRVGMEVENLTHRELTVHPPAIDSSVPFPIDRWYVVGEAGEPWDGTLPSRSKYRINVVGYLGEPVKPGATVDATIRFESLDFRIETAARRRWNEDAASVRGADEASG